MRCQDCGQQFTRWEAFKTHLRMHVLEEDEENRRRTAKRPADAGPKGTSNTATEQALPEKRRRTTTTTPEEEEEEEGGSGNSDVDVDGVDERQDDGEFFDCSWQVKPSEIIKVRPRVAMLSVEEKPVFSSSTRVYACSVCGKVYSYLESFRNHQKMHEQEALVVKRRPLDHKCDHPGCGKAFSRAGHLVIHRKVHRIPAPVSPEPLHCNQCNKNFNSLQTWMIHMELHKQKPYWCLACAKGFKDEVSLDKHLQGHNLRRHKCDICHKSFRVPAELKYHYNTHTGAKPYKCTLCKKDFSQMGNLITHRKKHVGVYLGASKTPLGSKNHALAGRRRVEEMKRLVFTGSGNPKEVIKRHVEVLEGQEDQSGSEEVVAEKVTSGPKESGSSTSSSSGSGSEESTSESSKSSSSDSSEESESDSSDSSGSGVEEPRGEEEEDDEEPEEMAQTAGMVETKQRRHRGEWECFECDVAFDHQSELHMHYMKHASGELSLQ